MKWLRSILLVVIGALSIFLGCISFERHTGDVETFKEYGGEAYTGIQNTEARTGANVRFQSEIIKEGIGNMFVIGGLLIIALAIPTKSKAN